MNNKSIITNEETIDLTIGPNDSCFKCKGKPHKWCEEHQQGECGYHHRELHRIVINVEFVDVCNCTECQNDREPSPVYNSRAKIR